MAGSNTASGSHFQIHQEREMNLPTAQRGFLLSAVCLSIAGCAKAPSAAPPVLAPISPCETLVLKATDLGGLLHAPITHATELAGDGQSCAFLTAGFSAITVSVRPGLGKASLEAWSTGKMPLPVRPLDGIGDAAVWQETLHEVIAQKKMCCAIFRFAAATRTSRCRPMRYPRNWARCATEPSPPLRYTDAQARLIRTCKIRSRPR
jgi:hypothetical protein